MLSVVSVAAEVSPPPAEDLRLSTSADCCLESIPDTTSAGSRNALMVQYLLDIPDWHAKNYFVLFDGENVTSR